MAERNRSTKRTGQPIIKPTGSDYKNAEAKETNGGSGTGGRQTGTGTDTGKERAGISNETTQVSNVDKPNKVSITLPSGEELKPEQTPKKKTSKKNKKKEVDCSAVKATIQAISNIVALRPQIAYWQLRDEEIDSIAQPLANIIDKYGAMNKLNEVSDGVQLFLACTAIATPRIMFMMSVHKEAKKTNVKNHNKEVKTNDQETDQVQEPSGENPRPNAATSPSDGEALSSLIPTVG